MTREDHKVENALEALKCEFRKPGDNLSWRYCTVECPSCTCHFCNKSEVYHEAQKVIIKEGILKKKGRLEYWDEVVLEWPWSPEKISPGQNKYLSKFIDKNAALLPKYFRVYASPYVIDNILPDEDKIFCKNIMECKDSFLLHDQEVKNQDKLFIKNVIEGKDFVYKYIEYPYSRKDRKSRKYREGNENVICLEGTKGLAELEKNEYWKSLILQFKDEIEELRDKEIKKSICRKEIDSLKYWRKDIDWEPALLRNKTIIERFEDYYLGDVINKINDIKDMPNFEQLRKDKYWEPVFLRNKKTVESFENLAIQYLTRNFKTESKVKKLEQMKKDKDWETALIRNGVQIT